MDWNRRNLEKLADMDFESLVIWKCETRDPKALAERISVFLENRKE